MSILLDRLADYDTDDQTGKTKLGIHPFVDAITLHLKGWSGAPSRQEINAAFKLSGQPFDPGNTQVDDLDLLIALPRAAGAARRTAREIESVLRLAEYFSNTITKARVESMLGVTLST